MSFLHFGNQSVQNSFLSINNLEKFTFYLFAEK